MPAIKVEVGQAIARLANEVDLLSKRIDDKRVKLKAYPPATAQEIKRYEDYLEMSLPDSYRTFLEIHNGYDWLVYPGHMLSISAVMPGGSWCKKIRDWKKMSADYGSGEVLDGIVIANLGQPNNWAFLDPNTHTGKGEFAIVRWLSGDSSVYQRLVDFLSARARFCKNY
jgi:SMI1/KNR4 family protein SUKH-1